MKPIGRVALATFCLALTTSGAAQTGTPDTPDHYVFRAYPELFAGEPSGFRLAAKKLYYANSHGARDLVLLDVLAETLLVNLASSDRERLDGMAWLCLTLGRSRNGRYREVLNVAVERSPKKKLKGHCQKALRYMPKGGSVPTYQPGSMRLPGA